MKPDSKTGRVPEAYGSRREWAPEMRLKMARAVVDGGVPGRTLSDALGIPLTTLQGWMERYRKYGADGVLGVISVRGRARPNTEVRKGADERREAVRAQKREHPEQGSRRISDVLERFQGLGVSESTVRRILHEEGLLEKRDEPREKPAAREVRFERAEPNQLWQSDIFTFLLRRHERLYVAAFLDDYSRYVVSLVVAHHQRASLVLEALTRGIADYGAPREVLTDQGRQYVAWRGQTEFEEELRRQGIRHIKSRPHHPQTQGKIERFWKTLWEEFLSRTVFADFGDCQRRIELYVQAYNFRRPHQGIEGLVPADRFFRAAPQVRDAIERGVAANALALAHEKPQRKPFYLVGRLGEKDLSVALVGEGLLIRVGDFEEVLKLGEGDKDAKRSEKEAEPCATDAEVADEGRGNRSGGEGAMLDGAGRAFGAEAGDGGDRGSGDLAGDVLPAGDAGASGDAAGARPLAYGEGQGASEADQETRGEGEDARAGATTLGAAPAADAEGGEGRCEGTGAANALDWTWQESFAKLPPSEDEHFDPDDGWRGRALTWERKLAGASHGEDLPESSEGIPGAVASLQGGDRGPGRSLVSERGGAPAEALTKSIPERNAPGTGGAIGGSSDQATGTSFEAGKGKGTPEGAAAAAAGERTAPETGGEHGSSSFSGSGAPDEGDA
jgi:transposase InsO family protein